MKKAGVFTSCERAFREIRTGKWFSPVSAIVYDCLLFLLLSHFCLYVCTNWIADKVWLIDEHTIDILIRVLMGISVVMEIFYSPLRAFAACALVIIFCFVPITYPQYLLCEIFILTFLSNLGTRKNNLNMWLFIHAFCYGMLLLLRMGGWVGQAYAGEGKFALGNIGKSYGLVHPNSFAIFCMTVLLAMWIYRKRKTWTAFLVFVPGAALVFYLTWSRTAAAAMLLFPFIMAAAEQLKRIRDKQAAWLVGLFPWLMVLITLCLSLYAINNSPEELARRAFWMRFTDFRVIVNYSISYPFGIYGSGPYSEIWFDNLYWWLTAYCGVMTAAAALVGYSYMNIRLWKEKRIDLLAVALMFLIYAVMENALVYPFHFFVPLLAFARPDGEMPDALSPLTENQIV